METTTRAGKERLVFPQLALMFLIAAHSSLAEIIFSKEPYSQDALNGRGAILRCEVENPTGIQFDWLHNGVPVKSTDRRYKEGSNLQFTAVDRREDSGNFQCVAKNNFTGEEARTSNASFNIKWLEPGGVVLKDPSSVLDIKTSKTVVFQCHIDGHPRPTCQWFRGGSPVIDGTSYITNNKDRTLTLKSPSPDDNGVYYCCARNAVGYVCSNANFSLQIIDESFPRAVVIPQNQIVSKHEEAIFHCQFSAVPHPVQKWYFENETAPITNKSRMVVFSNGSLLVTQVRPKNTGVYKCIGQGSKGKPLVLEASLHLAEIEDLPPLPSRTFPASTKQQVECPRPRGVPEPLVWWEKAGTRIPTAGRVHQDGRELIFTNVEEEDNGVYTCFAENKAGQKKQELNITVATVPTWVEAPKESSLEEGKPGYLHCYTKASPEPTVTWYRNNIDISEDPRFKIFENGTLRINNVDVYDATTYNCASETDAGRIEGSARVHVLVKLKFTPTPQPHQCLELDKESTVQCSATGRETPTVQWIKTDGTTLPPNIHQNSGQLHFMRVTKSDAGNYTCLATNNIQGEIRAVVQLQVVVFVSFTLTPDNTTVYQGHTAVLNCKAAGDPQPSIQWKVKDKILDASKSNPRIQTMPNGSLVIRDVTSEDSGKYTCIAGHSCNIKHTDAFLYVVEKPTTRESDETGQTPYKMIQTIGLSVGAAVAYIIIVLALMFYCKKRRKAKRQQKHGEGEEPEMECLNGATIQQNGQTTAEIQEEVAMTSLNTATSAAKRHSINDRLHFPRSNLQMLTTLGKGEFGEVFLAKAKGVDESEEETVVLVKSLQARDEQLQLDFRREFEMFGKLNHSNVVKLLGLCREAEPHYMILEYVDLGDLKQFLRIAKSRDEKIKAPPVSTKQKVSICTQVALGMEHLSNSRFVHKDLAARNCLISAQRQVKVSALSLSKDVYNSEYYNFRQALLPLRWMPTEAIVDGDFSTKSDVWSFGVLMWEVFTQGEMPYSKLSDEAVLSAAQNGKLKLSAPDGLPSKLNKLMQRCCAASPKDRPSFSEIANCLGEMAADSKV